MSRASEGEGVRRIFAPFCLSFFWIMFLSVPAFACSCISPGTPCQEYGRAGATFIGTVVAVKTADRTLPANRDEIDWTPRTFKFSVEERFSGVDGPEVEVKTGRGGGDCGYDFKLGERYLVYAYRSTSGSHLTTGICSRTKPYAKAEEDLEFLRKLSSLVAGVTIFGEVKHNRQSVARGDSVSSSPLIDALLTVEGEGERKEIRTDAQGRYRLTGLRAGRYKVTLALPPELTVYKAQQEVTVADRGCAAVNYFVTDNGRISGRVLDTEGRGAAGILIVLAEAGHTDPLKNYSKIERSDDEGRYSFSAVPPGQYFLAVNLNRFPQVDDPTNAYPRTFYPGVSEPAAAELIKLDAGEELRERDFQLPFRRLTSVLSGKVVWDDGVPVMNAGISLRDVSYHDPGSDNALQADDQGYFTIKGYVGQTIRITARSNRPHVGAHGLIEKSTPLTITLANPSHSIRIVITKLR